MRRGVTPMRARRRQSDAKWRASVAMCYEIMKNVIPEHKKLNRRKVSKALILKETEKHIISLESKIKELMKEKASRSGKVVIVQRDEEHYEPARFRDLQDEFAEKQLAFFASGTAKKRYNVPADIEASLQSISQQRSDLIVVEKSKMKCGQMIVPRHHGVQHENKQKENRCPDPALSPSANTSTFEAELTPHKIGCQINTRGQHRRALARSQGRSLSASGDTWQDQDSCFGGQPNYRETSRCNDDVFTPTKRERKCSLEMCRSRISTGVQTTEKSSSTTEMTKRPTKSSGQDIVKEMKDSTPGKMAHTPAESTPMQVQRKQTKSVYIDQWTMMTPVKHKTCMRYSQSQETPVKTETLEELSTPSTVSAYSPSTNATPSKECTQLPFSSPITGFTPVKLPLEFNEDGLMSLPSTPAKSLGSPFSGLSLPRTPLSCIKVEDCLEMTDEEDTSLLCTESMENMDLEEPVQGRTPCKYEVKEEIQEEKDRAVSTDLGIMYNCEDRGIGSRRQGKPKCRRRLEESYPVEGDVIPKSSAEEESDITDGMTLLDTDDSCLEFDGYFMFYQQHADSADIPEETQPPLPVNKALAVSKMWESLSPSEKLTYKTIASFEHSQESKDLSEDLLNIDLKPLVKEEITENEVDIDQLKDLCLQYDTTAVTELEDTVFTEMESRARDSLQLVPEPAVTEIPLVYMDSQVPLTPVVHEEEVCIYDMSTDDKSMTDGGQIVPRGNTPIQVEEEDAETILYQVVPEDVTVEIVST